MRLLEQRREHVTIVLTLNCSNKERIRKFVQSCLALPKCTTGIEARTGSGKAGAVGASGAAAATGAGATKGCGRGATTSRPPKGDRGAVVLKVFTLGWVIFLGNICLYVGIEPGGGWNSAGYI